MAPMTSMSLYGLAVATYVRHLSNNAAQLNQLDELRTLPVGPLADILKEMCKYTSLVNILERQFTNLDIFLPLLRHSSARWTMFRCMRVLMDNSRFRVMSELCEKFNRLCYDYQQDVYLPLLAGASMEPFLFPGGPDRCRSGLSADVASFADRYVKHIHLGIQFSTFMTEVGCPAFKILHPMLTMIRQLPKDPSRYILQITCLQKLLAAQTKFLEFRNSKRTLQVLLDTVKLMQKMEEAMSGMLLPSTSMSGDLPHTWMILPPTLLASVYQQISQLHFYTSEYDICYYYGILALNYIDNETPPQVVVDVLREAAKACVLKRKFTVAGILIKKAVRVARDTFGAQHQKYADTLLDYGYYLQNVDSILGSITVHTNALNVYYNLHGLRNMHVGIAHKNLAYALYVRGLTSGKFLKASWTIDRAISILNGLVKPDHLSIAEAKHLKAQMNVTLAVSSNASQSSCDVMLQQAKKQLYDAAKVEQDMLGNNNVITATFFDSLGRLYQAMKRYKHSEHVYKMAIKMKRRLLGPQDHEVGQSIGHLAYLYKCMGRLREAANLYLESIDIGLLAFGPTYSGLRDNYYELMGTYFRLNDDVRGHHYMDALNEWHMMRRDYDDQQADPYDDILREDVPLEEVRRKGLALCPPRITSSRSFVR